MRDITWLEYWLLMFAIGITTWQLMWFFFIDDGRVQKWRLRKSVDAIRRYIKNNIIQGGLPTALTITYRNKTFEIGILEEEVNYYYKYYHIFINGDDAAKYHCLKHCCLNSYQLEMLNGRWSHEVTEILHAGRKHLKKLERAADKNAIPEYKEKSYFN
jgi:hypothetical protein